MKNSLSIDAVILECSSSIVDDGTGGVKLSSAVDKGVGSVDVEDDGGVSVSNCVMLLLLSSGFMEGEEEAGKIVGDVGGALCDVDKSEIGWAMVVERSGMQLLLRKSGALVGGLSSNQLMLCASISKKALPKG